MSADTKVELKEELSEPEIAIPGFTVLINGFNIVGPYGTGYYKLYPQGPPGFTSSGLFPKEKVEKSVKDLRKLIERTVNPKDFEEFVLSFKNAKLEFAGKKRKKSRKRRKK